MFGNMILRFTAGQTFQCQLLRSLVTQAAVQLPAEGATQQVSQADPNRIFKPSGVTNLCRCGKANSNTLPRLAAVADPTQRGPNPGWWSDPRVNAFGAYKIIMKRLSLHGSQRKHSAQQHASQMGLTQHTLHGCRRRKLQATIWSM